MDKASIDKLTMAFGFNEALDALNRLVDMATVGGKKEKPEPEEDSDRRKFKAAISDVAQMTRYIYEGFTDAGFDDDQAFELTCMMIPTFNCGLGK